MLNSESALQTAQAVWDQIASEVGLSAANYSMTLLRSGVSNRFNRIVARLESEMRPEMVLRLYLSGVHVGQFQNMILAHQRAADVFEDQRSLHVPKLLYGGDTVQATLMKYAPGYTAHDALGLAVSTEDRADIMHACGVWIGFFHQATFRHRNDINPNAMQKFIATQQRRVETDALKVPNAEQFILYSRNALETAERMRGKKTRLAATHGDLSARNLIIGPEGTYGTGFSAVHNAPIGHDLARFFVSFGTYHYPEDAKLGDATWLASDYQNFFEGYGEAYEDDPSFYYLVRMQLLKEWASIPETSHARTAQQERRWKGIQLLLDLLF